MSIHDGIKSKSSQRKPLATLSVDLDNEWSYLKTHGDKAWEDYPSYLDTLVPRLLEVFRLLNLKPTVFVVGRDAALSKNREALRMLACEGYEIGNHSFEHEAWVDQKDEQQFAAELLAAEESIAAAVGTRPSGFRGPGFSSSRAIINVLCRRGYRYDASNLPTFVGPLARLYYFWTSNLTRAERESRERLFGSFRNAFQPIRPYYVGLNGFRLLEIPVTTMPVFRIPFHVSYVLYLSTYSPKLALLYWRMALQLCLWRKTPPSVLLHPLDFLGCDDTRTLSFFPGMNLTSEVKLARVVGYLRELISRFQVLSLGEFSVRFEQQRRYSSR